MDLTIEQILQKGIEAHQAGQFQEANRLYNSILKVQPKHPDANHNMGVLTVGFGKAQEALPFFKTALEANPSVAQFWLSYIDVLLQLTKKDEAKAALNQAKKYNLMGDGFDALKKKLSSLEQTSNLDFQNQVLPQDQLEAVINLYNQGLLQQVLGKTSELLKSYPDSAILHNIQGAANNGLMQFNAAIKSFKEAINIKFDFPDAHNNLGIALQEQGKLEEAISAFEKSLSINPNYADAYYNMGIALQKQGNLVKAIEACNKAINLKPDFADAHNNLGLALQEQGKLKEAISAFNNALSINPSYTEVHYNMGDVLKEQDKMEEAIKAYQRALTIKPDYAQAKHMLSALTGKSTNVAPREYIENLFDKHAKNFDKSLVNELDYQTPRIILELAKKKHGDGLLGSILDLGCGTGLFGSEVKEFCEVNFDIDFPLTSITDVKGDNAHEIYQWAKENYGNSAVPKWNFYKILVNRQGKIEDTFSSLTNPMSKKITNIIEKIL